MFSFTLIRRLLSEKVKQDKNRDLLGKNAVQARRKLCDVYGADVLTEFQCQIDFVPEISILKMHWKGSWSRCGLNKVVARWKLSNNNSGDCSKIKSVKRDRSQAHETSTINFQA